MLRSAFAAFYRSLARHPLYAALNLFGLSFGVAAFLVLSLFVRFETSYEQWIPHAGAIYELTTGQIDRNGQEAKRRFSSAGIAIDGLSRELPGRLETRVVTCYIIVGTGASAQDEEGQLVDPNVFRVFNLDWLAGDAGTAVRTGGIVLSEAMARKYFGRTDVVGRTLILRDDLGPLVPASYRPPSPQAYVVTGVLKNPPANSSLHFDFVRLLTPERMAVEPDWTDWSLPKARTFAYLPRAGDVAVLQSRLVDLVDRFGTDGFYDRLYAAEPRHSHIILHLVRLTSEHLADPKAATSVLALGLVGVVAFGVALINYVNLATARSGLRAREVAVRKVMGATRGMIRLQFLTEAVLISLVAGLFGFSLVELCLPAINAVGGLSLRLDYVRDGPVLLGLMGCVLWSGLLAGVYPALILSGFEPAIVLASTRSPVGGGFGQRLREGLVMVQFTVVCVFFIVIIGFSAQLHHMETSDLGFDRDGLLITDSTVSTFLKPAEVESIMRQWQALPNVVSVTTGSVPGPYFQTGSLRLVGPGAPGKPGTHYQPRVMVVGRDFFRTFGTVLLAGRAVDDRDRITSRQMPVGAVPGTINIDINLAMARALGFATPAAAIGQTTVYKQSVLRIVGVVVDQRFASPTDTMGPALYLDLTESNEGNMAVVRFAGVPRDVIEARMTAIWRRFAPDLPLVTQSGVEALDTYYRDDRRNTSLFAVGAVFAGLVGAIGLFGMAAFNTSNRALEIGLRKVMGASRGRIAGLLLLQFLRPVAIANAVAWPIAWVALAQWLSQFDDQVSLSPWFFLAGSGLSLILAAVTVAGVALATAQMSPGRAIGRG